MESALEELVHINLNRWLYDSAAFYAERLLSQRPSEESVALLAMCYALSGKTGRAHAVLQGCAAPQNRYMLANLCCAQQRYAEAQRVLLEGTSAWDRGLDEVAIRELARLPCPVPGGAAGFYLLGVAARGEGQIVQATRCFRLALMFDPKLWSAFEALCALGDEVGADSLFVAPFGATGAPPPEPYSAAAGALAAAHGPSPRLSEATRRRSTSDDAAAADAAAAPAPLDQQSSAFDIACRPAVPPLPPQRQHHQVRDAAGRAFSCPTLATPPGFASPALASHIFGPESVLHQETGALSSDRNLNSSALEGSPSVDDSMGPPPPRDLARHYVHSGQYNDAATITPVGGGRLSFGALSHAGAGASVSLSALDFNAEATPARATAALGVNRTGGPLFQTPGLTPINGRSRDAARDDPETPAFGTGQTPQAELRRGSTEPSRAALQAPAARESSGGRDGSHEEGRRLFSGFADAHVQWRQDDAVDCNGAAEKPAEVRRPTEGGGVSAASDASAEESAVQDLLTLAAIDESVDMDVDGAAAARSVDTLRNENKSAAASQLPSMQSGGGGADPRGEQKTAETTEPVQPQPDSSDLARLIRTFGAAQQQLASYRCRECIQTLNTLPPLHFNSGWAQGALGRALFETGDYIAAKEALQLMARWEPHRMEGLEVLSTVLWHLHEDVELCYLAQRVAHKDRTSPAALCVLGNCFSLQKEHHTALKFFRRAVQLDPSMAYAHTLCGHEHVSNEEWEKATACYRAAITVDRRHYNAWYGLGAIYYRLEKYEIAEYHFQKALSINAQSSVLRCYLGMTQHANKRYYEALETLNAACMLEPLNPQARFQKANVLMSMERYDEARRELEAVRDAVPREGTVYFTLGKVWQKLGRQPEALRYFTAALDLMPKDNSLVKAAIDLLDHGEDESQWA